MPTSQQESDALWRSCGYSQKYLDDVNNHVDDYRARHGNDPPQPLWEGPSDTESEDAYGAPLSPPPSPRSDGLDLSLKAYDRCLWSDLSRGLPSQNCAFGGYEKWRSHMISDHSQKSLPPSILLHESGIRKRHPGTRKKHRFTGTVSARLTRSKASMTSLFYELRYDGKTTQLVTTSSGKNPTAFSFRVTRSSRQNDRQCSRRDQRHIALAQVDSPHHQRRRSHTRSGNNLVIMAINQGLAGYRL